jgi:hypothetical protein
MSRSWWRGSKQVIEGHSAPTASKVKVFRRLCVEPPVQTLPGSHIHIVHAASNRHYPGNTHACRCQQAVSHVLPSINRDLRGRRASNGKDLMVRRCRDHIRSRFSSRRATFGSMHRSMQVNLPRLERYQVAKPQDEAEPGAEAPVVCRNAGHAERYSCTVRCQLACEEQTTLPHTAGLRRPQSVVPPDEPPSTAQNLWSRVSAHLG